MTLRGVEYLVFDEADRLFEMGFADQLKQVMATLAPSRQTLLFSATLPKALAEFARAGLRDPELVRLDADTKISPDLALAFFTLRCALRGRAGGRGVGLWRRGVAWFPSVLLGRSSAGLWPSAAVS